MPSRTDSLSHSVNRFESLFTEDDLAWAAGQLPENSSAALFLWENLWMDNIRKAMVASGAVLALARANSRRFSRAVQE